MAVAGNKIAAEVIINALKTQVIDSGATPYSEEIKGMAILIEDPMKELRKLLMHEEIRIALT